MEERATINCSALHRAGFNLEKVNPFKPSRKDEKGKTFSTNIDSVEKEPRDPLIKGLVKHSANAVREKASRTWACAGSEKGIAQAGGQAGPKARERFLSVHVPLNSSQQPSKEPDSPLTPGSKEHKQLSDKIFREFLTDM